MPGRRTTRSFLDAMDGHLSRLGVAGSSVLLTVIAILVASLSYNAYRYAVGLPIRLGAAADMGVAMAMVLYPMMFFCRRVITELKKSRAELADVSRRLEIAAEQAHQANRAKSTFLANMSHELRTPLNAIMGFSEIMKDQHLGPVNNPRYLSYSKDIHASGRYLLNIINDILDLSKIEAGKMSLESAEDFAFAPTVQGSLAMIQSLGDKFEVALVNNLPDDGVRLMAVERMVRQILINLVGNAIKFTPAGGKVCITGGALDDGGYAVTVRDSGVGMSAEDIVVALTPFGQIANLMGAKHAGTGLGLPLAKAMMELHGGTLAISSTPYKGTCVTLRFPPSRITLAAPLAAQVA